MGDEFLGFNVHLTNGYTFRDLMQLSGKGSQVSERMEIGAKSQEMV